MFVSPFGNPVALQFGARKEIKTPNAIDGAEGVAKQLKRSGVDATVEGGKVTVPEGQAKRASEVIQAVVITGDLPLKFSGKATFVKFA